MRFYSTSATYDVIFFSNQWKIANSKHIRNFRNKRNVKLADAKFSEAEVTI